MSYTLATIHTWFDLLHSTIAPDALITAAERLKLAAIGIVDHATTLGHVPLVRAARDSNVHVVLGATLAMEDDVPIRILARTDEGYRNLCRLVSAQNGGQPRLAWDLLRAHKQGLYLLCGGRRGRVWQAVASGDSRALLLLSRMQALAERDDRFLLECQQYHDDTVADGETLRQLLELASRAGVRCIATHDVQVLNNGDGRTHRLLRAIDQRANFWSNELGVPAWSKAAPSRYALPTPQAWFKQWDGLAHLVAGSSAVLKDCDVELLGRRRFPGASLTPERVYDDLLNRALAGIRQRYPLLTRELIERLLHEVNEVHAQGVAPFLIHAAELVERAAARGIRMILQGSGTGSLVCYALGISPVDPTTAQGLVFERFAGTHRGRGDLPDLDFGIPAGREADVKAILVAMFGAQRVAHLAAVVTLKERGALREAAAAFGWTNEHIDLLRQKLKSGHDLDREERMVVNAAAAIAGQPHHLMQHASGLIVADEPLQDVYGVSLGTDGALLLADKDDVEQLQVLKFDILRWYGSAIFDQAEAAIHAAVYPKPELWKVESQDPATAELFARGDTRAIPYLQSPAMLALMYALKVRDEPGIALALGALRPGASTTRPRLMAALHDGTTALDGWDVLTPEHQQMISEVLATSYGAFLFDEDLLRVAHVLGLSLADAERLRKALKKGDESAKTMSNKLRGAALERGWYDQEVDVVLGWLTYIQRYTFLRGHALALAHVAWRLARVAAHYPNHFHAAVLDQLGVGDESGGMYPQLVYVVEARRHGLTLQGPTINSDWLSTAHGDTIRCGLRVLRSTLSLDTLQRMHAEARLRPFTSVADLRARVELTQRELDKLISAGALDTVVPSRRHARWEARARAANRRDQPPLLDVAVTVPVMIAETETNIERAREEYATLGWTISVEHPLDLYHTTLQNLAVVPTECLGAYIGQQVTIAGVSVAYRRIRTTKETRMGFVSLCDATGVAELTLFEAALQQAHGTLERGGLVIATGRVVEDAERGIGVEVQHIRPLEQVDGD